MTEQIIKLYRPSNGTDGDSFQNSWCANCEQDKVLNGTVEIEDSGTDDYCQIINDSMCYDIDHPKYPKQWQYKDGKPICTAFVRIGEVVKERCDKTADMFESMKAKGE